MLVAAFELQCDAVGAVLLARELINLPPTGAKRGSMGGGVNYAPDDPRQRARDRRRRWYRLAAALLVPGFALQAVAAIGSALSD